ncbi:MAG: histidinol-phosphate transaminase [Pseudomonadota bacterium]
MIDTELSALVAPGIPGLSPYLPGKPISELERELGISGAIKLASNENPLGPSPQAVAAMTQALAEVARYPDGGGFALRHALAARHGVDDSCVTLGNGSNDVLDLVARTFLQPGTNAVFSEHAFAVYPIATQAAGAGGRVALAKAYGHDLAAMRQLVDQDTRVVWIANPNNPTGTYLGENALWGFLEALPKTTLAVVDEAYIEYVEAPDYPDTSRWLVNFPRLIVTRTFSKAYGLAGLRVGYGLSHPKVAALLNRVRQPFNINNLAQTAALAALADQAHIRTTVMLHRRGMNQLTLGFRALGLAFIPSQGNFVTVDVGRPAGPVDQALLRAGVIVRPVANYGLPNHLRVTVGHSGENQRFLKALAEILAKT